MADSTARKVCTSIALASIWVVDSTNDRVQKFDSSASYLSKCGSNGNGQFQDPDFIVTDSSGSVYVTDQTRNIVQKFDSSGS